MLTIALAVSLAASLAFATPEETARRQAVEHHRAGEELMRAERYEQAVEAFRKAIALDPLLVIAHYNLGQSYMALKRYVEAVLAYRGAEDAILRIGALSGAAREERERANMDEIHELKSLALVLEKEAARQGRVDSGVVRIEERIRLLENMRLKGQEALRVPAELNLALGSAYFRQNKLAEAEEAYVKAVRANAKLGAAHNNLAVIYMLSGRFAEAKGAVAAAEKAGFKVDPRLKADIQTREAAARP